MGATTTRTILFKVYGMDCADEVRVLRDAVGQLDGVQNLAFNLLEGVLTVTVGDARADPARIVAAIARAGMRASIRDDANASEAEGSRWDRVGRTVMTTASGVLLVVALMAGSKSGPLATGLLIASAVAGLWSAMSKAVYAARRFRPDMNLLVVLAAAGAVVLGDLLEAATVSFLFAISLALESWSVGRARRAIGELMALTPARASVLDESGDEVLRDVQDVAVGAKLVIKPGERVPLDARIIAGETTVNQAAITGESMPVSKSVGDEVFAGSVNNDGAIEAHAVKPASESTVAQIIKMVREAQSKRSPSEQWVQRFARRYTPAVTGFAVLVATVPPLLGGHWNQWLYESLVLLVIACPCALVISTPVSIVSALAAAARNGILVKGGVYVEVPAKIKVLAVDKTGTLTEGRPRVSRLVPLGGRTADELLRTAAAIEARSEHSLGNAIVAHAIAVGVRVGPVSDYQAVKERGATASLNGNAVWVGSPRYVTDRGLGTPAIVDQMRDLAVGGGTVIAVGDSKQVIGFVALADHVRADVPSALQALKRAGVKRIVMLTGDNRSAAEAVARASGVDEFRPELLPQDKVAAIEELERRYGPTAMLGDGVNDAPALARSSLGIAMGVAGTAAAVESAAVALMSEDLGKLAWLVLHSRRSLGVIRQNIAASVLVKAAFVVLTFTGSASLWTAIAADTGVSLLVIMNALRLLTTRSRSN